MKHIIPAVVATTMLVGAAHAEIILVEIEGQVVFNAIGDSPLGDVGFGDSALMSFTVDSNNFVDGVPGDVRGYEIDQSSFSLSFGGGAVVQGLLDPFPGGDTPYFGVIDGFPVSDGFFVSTSTVSPGGVPLEQTPFQANFSVSYLGDTLDSLDILDAVGTYDFTGLTVFGFNLWSIFPDNVAMEMDYEQMTISIVPAPATLALLLPLALIGRRRRE